MTKDELLAALPLLKRADLEAVHVTAAALLGGRLSSVTSPASPLVVLTYDALTTTLGLTVPYSAFMGTVPGKRFESRAVSLGDFLTKAIKGWDETKVLQIAVLRLIFELLKENLKRRKINPTMASMTYNIGVIPKVFDDAFPGYIEAGLTAGILKRLKNLQ